MINNLNAIGIKTKFEYLKYAAFRDKVQDGGSPFNFGTWGSYSINDVSAITSHFQSGGKDDYSKDAEVIKQLKIGDTNVDPKVRKDAYKAALSESQIKCLCSRCGHTTHGMRFQKMLISTQHQMKSRAFHCKMEIIIAARLGRAAILSFFNG